jgi:hypothetical protein
MESKKPNVVWRSSIDPYPVGNNPKILDSRVLLNTGSSDAGHAHRGNDASGYSFEQDKGDSEIK